jgi:hypothetical protein
VESGSVSVWQHTHFSVFNARKLLVNFSNYNHLFVLQTAHEKYIRNKIVPSLYAMSTDDVISDVALDDDNENQPSNELKSSISVPEKNGLV